MARRMSASHVGAGHLATQSVSPYSSGSKSTSGGVIGLAALRLFRPLENGMTTATLAKAAKLPFKVKDEDLWELGRKEIELAEVEMPGLMALREKYGKSK